MVFFCQLLYSFKKLRMHGGISLALIVETPTLSDSCVLNVLVQHPPTHSMSSPKDSHCVLELLLGLGLANHRTQ